MFAMSAFQCAQNGGLAYGLHTGITCKWVKNAKINLPTKKSGQYLYLSEILLEKHLHSPETLMQE